MFLNEIQQSLREFIGD